MLRFLNVEARIRAVNKKSVGCDENKTKEISVVK